MPIHPSPTYHKYDVTDYCAIAPEYGTMEDFDAFLARAHELGIRVHTWTVDEPEHIRRLCEMDVDAIITNKPDIALEIANSFK